MQPYHDNCACIHKKTYKNPADLVTFTEKILNVKLQFLCSVIRCKSNLYKTFVRGKNSVFHLLIFQSKVAKKLSDPSTSTKCYWSLLKTLLNDQKLPCIPPIFHNNEYIIDFKEKSEIFNTFFAEQCSLIPNKSVLPSRLTLLTENSLSKCNFSKKDVLQIIRNLDSNQAHGHDMISIQMLKLCDDSIYKPLELISKRVYEMVDFHWNGEKPMLSLFIRKVIKKLSETIVQFHFYLFVAKYLNACFMTVCLIFFLRIIYFLQINLDSDQEILASINFFQLIMKS